jgi:hypothetical protein
LIVLVIFCYAAAFAEGSGAVPASLTLVVLFVLVVSGPSIWRGLDSGHRPPMTWGAVSD